MNNIIFYGIKIRNTVTYINKNNAISSLLLIKYNYGLHYKSKKAINHEYK